MTEGNAGRPERPGWDPSHQSTPRTKECQAQHSNSAPHYCTQAPAAGGTNHRVLRCPG
jgi:hypothetical protein